MPPVFMELVLVVDDFDAHFRHFDQAIADEQLPQLDSIAQLETIGKD